MIYFDNAATSNFKPREVVDAFLSGVTKYSVNPNRSVNPQTNELTDKILSVRKKIATFVGLNNPLNAVFCLNCTDALNLAILGSIKKRGEHIVSSVLEHNSVLRPLHRLKERGYANLTLLSPDQNLMISPQSVENAINSDTTMVVLAHVSNVTGATQNIKAIGDVCRRRGVKFLVDGAQSVGYIKIDMKQYKIDLLALPAHKGLHGTVGCGVLCFADDSCAPKPIRYGGTGTQSNLLTQPTQSPEAYESGTINSPAILALGAAIDYTNQNGTAYLRQTKLVQNTIIEGLLEIKKVKLFTAPNDSGIVTFKIGEADSLAICDTLATNYGILTRGGLHCAPLCHKFLGTTHTGLTRLSVSGSNTLAEAYIFLNAIQQIIKMM